MVNNKVFLCFLGKYSIILIKIQGGDMFRKIRKVKNEISIEDAKKILENQKEASFP